jgi:single-stranded-DNA-specific exonuclease
MTLGERWNEGIMQINLNILQKNPDIDLELVAAAYGNKIAAEILYGRGYDTAEKIKDFFLEGYNLVQTSDMPDIDKAVERIRTAIENKEKVCIYGDYDVDGVTSTSILKECMAEIGADCTYHVPDRFTEGYGMNSRVVESLSATGIKLIVTCDCGISNVVEIDLAKRLGMDVIVTDHHSIPDQLPPAFCIINPKLWGETHKAYHVSGAVAAFYLARALLESFGKEQRIESFLDLMALSIVADVVPLTSENRYWLKRGLSQISKGGRIGLNRLVEKTSRFGKMDEEFIGFQIAPRLNAAGRLESARKGVELLTAGDDGVAASLAEELNFLNISRKEIAAEIFKNAEEMIAAYRGRPKNIIILYNETWHHGVIGITAGKLCEKYNKPVVLLSLKEDGKTVTGSARAPEGVPMYEILQRCSEALIKFGGHAGAAGLSLELSRLDSFIKKAEKVAYEYDVDQSKTVNVDMELKIENITEELAKSLTLLSPFGEGFRQPVFLTTGVDITANLPIKDIGRRLMVSNNSINISALYWEDAEFTSTGKGYDIAYTVNESEFKGKKEIKLNILQILEKEEAKKAKQDYIKIVDMRNNQDFCANYRPEYGDAIFFEGVHNLFKVKTFNRYEIDNVKHLIFYSIPASLKVLKEILRKAEPQKVTFVFNDSIDSTEDIFKNAVGILKYIISNKKGKTSYAELICLLGINYELIDAIIKYLSFSGLIEVEEDYDDLIITKGTGKKFPQAEKFKQSFSMLAAEMNSFKSYIRTASLEILMTAYKE